MAVDLAVAAVAGQDQHAGPGCPDLVHLAAAVKNPFVIVPRGQRPAAPAAARLVQPVGMQIDPVFQALVHDPAGFFEIAVAEPFPGPPAVVAGVVVGGADIEAPAIQADTPAFDVFDQQVKHRHGFKFFERFGKPSLETNLVAR
jgi:hypothetical protein